MIDVQNLSFSYGKHKQSARILEKICFQIEKGHCLAILGNNGVGKSTLLKCLNKIIVPQIGRVQVNQKDLLQLSNRERAKYIAYVPQRNPISDIMVYDAVLLGRRPYVKWDITEKDRQIVLNCLEQFDLLEYASSSLNKLSGGELQKVILARSMAQEPEYLLLDEPTSNLDPKNQHDMLNMIQKLAVEKNLGVAIVLHDINAALRYCDRYLFLKEGKVYSFGDQAVINKQSFKDVYDIHVDFIEHNGHRFIINIDE